MKNFYLFVSIVINTSLLHAQAPNFAWANQYGNSGLSDATLLMLDEQGNSYMSGAYGSSGITLGAFTLSGIGGDSRFIAKFSPAGVVLWAKRYTKTIGVQDGRNTEKIAVDTLGNVYITGSYFPGATVDGVPLPGEYNLFLTKFDSNGVVVWTKTTSSPYFLNNSPCAIHVDSENNICMVGNYQASMSFSNTYSLTAENSSNVGAQSFLVKYDQAGDVVFASNIGEVDSMYNSNVGDADNDLFQFDVNDNIYRLADTLFTKYNSTGSQMFQFTIKADSGFMLLSSFAVDLNGNILFSGYFQNGPLVFMEDTIVQNGFIDAIIIKLDSNGTKQWIHQNLVTNNGSSLYSKVRVDGIGNIYATGKVISSLAVQPIMMLKINAQGSVLWDDLILSTNAPLSNLVGAIEPRNIVQARNGGNILVLGTFTTYIEFSSAVFFTTPLNVIRIFLAQYGNCTNTTVPSISGSPFEFCQGDSLFLTASASSSYLWSTGDTTQSIYANNMGNYYVLGIENNECYVQSNITQVNMLVAPNMSVIQNETTLTAEEVGATYQWINCNTNTAISGETNQNFTTNITGNYAVVITSANGCIDTSACFAINTLNTGEIDLQNMISISPNPANDLINIKTNSSLMGSTYRIFEITGKVILNGKISSENSQIDISKLSKGIYFLETSINEKQHILKIVKQ